MNPLPRARRNSGFTMIELIVVMGLLALLFGLGIGMLSTLNPGQRAAVGLVQNVVRSARNSARARSAPARVRLDPATGTLAATGMDVVGTWHFESLELEGSSGIDGVAMGGRIIEEGYLGQALSFSGEPAGSHAEIPVHQDPGFDLREGFVISCALELTHPSGGRVLDVGNVAGLELRSNGSLRAWFRPELTSPTGALSGGAIVAADSPSGVWSPGRWIRIEMHYDRRVLRLLVDGVEAARTDADPPVWKLEGTMMVGDPRSPFPGAIDTLSILAAVDNGMATLPKGVVFAPDIPRLIVFSPDGSLEREVHSGPLSIGLEYEDGARLRVAVSVYGTVE